MKIYYPFLKDYLNTDFSAKNMADIFTNLGLECESSNKTLNFDITPNLSLIHISEPTRHA